MLETSNQMLGLMLYASIATEWHNAEVLASGRMRQERQQENVLRLTYCSVSTTPTTLPRLALGAQVWCKDCSLYNCNAMLLTAHCKCACSCVGEDCHGNPLSD